MKSRVELLVLSLAKKACQNSDKTGFFRIDSECFLYTRELINSECIKTKGNTKYILLVNNTMLGINDYLEPVLINVIKQTIKSTVEYNQKNYKVFCEDDVVRQLN